MAQCTVPANELPIKALRCPEGKARVVYHIVGHGNATNYGSEGLRFLAPVPSGSKIHAHDRLISAIARPNGTLITTEIAVHLIGAEKPSLLYKMQILYMPKR